MPKSMRKVLIALIAVGVVLIVAGGVVGFRSYLSVPQPQTITFTLENNSPVDWKGVTVTVTGAFDNGTTADGTYRLMTDVTGKNASISLGDIKKKEKRVVEFEVQSKQRGTFGYLFDFQTSDHLIVHVPESKQLKFK